MSGSMSLFSSTFMIQEEDVLVNKKQGIISILECDNNNNNNNNKNRKISSLRRTLSADMSSKKWLTENGFNSSPPQMKKISSSLQLISLSISDDAEEETETESDSNESSPTQFDIWNSIISKKAAEGDNNNMSTPAYVHPLVRRSTSALSEKSLEICTESLGSETGSDGFSFEKGTDVEDDKKVVANVIPQQQQQKSCFPPPIPSLLRSDLRIMSHRDNGRLVLQAVPISQQNNNFKAQREGGRLVLTFSSANNIKQDVEPIEKSKESEELKDYSEAPNNLSGALLNVHRLALTVNKPLGLTSNMNETWCDKFNETVQLSLPPRQTMLIPSPFNAYEYYWRPKTMVEQSDDKFPVSRSCKMEDEKQLVILRGKTGDYLAKGFKEQRRRSLLSWKPYCVATT